ncbi:class I mannose-6-phosphate isomerase [Clostridiales bacterium COT073_COT-073]|nr:class I mannose-6-phosphate isomerase [Clostridiales bacterium COT073_COT-073]
MYPLKFEKVFKKKIWGGQKFATELNIELPDNDKYGESWELCSRASGVSRVVNGPLQGKTLEDIYQEYGSKLVGEEVFSEFPEKFPLLVKYLDIEGLLSIRVHPDDKYALKQEHDYGKSKSWYVLEASKDAKVIMGLADGVTKEEFLRRAAAKDFEGLFRIVPVKKGDFIDIEPGTVYSSYEGSLLVCEIQQNSETKYRIYDYERDRNGNPKEIHLEKAAEIMKYDHKPVISSADTRETMEFDGAKIQELVRHKYYNVDHMVIEKELLAEAYKNFKVLTIINGSGILYAGNEEYQLKKGDTYFIPSGVRVGIEGNVELLKSYL